MNLSEYIQKTLIEAHKQRINANTVFLNSEIALQLGEILDLINSEPI